MEHRVVSIMNPQSYTIQVGGTTNQSIYNSTYSTNQTGPNIAASNSTITSGTVLFANSNGVSFGLNGSTMTASFSGGGVGGGVAISAGTAQATSGTVTFGSSAGNVTFGMAAGYVTASAPTGGAGGAALQGSGTYTQNTGTVQFANSNNVTFGLTAGQMTASIPNFLTTAAQSNQVVNSLNGSTGQMSIVVGSSLSASSNASTITIGLASNISTYLQTTGAYLTTARASTDAIGLNTAQSNVTWTVNSSGLSLDARGYAGTNTAITGNALITMNSSIFSFNGSGLAGINTSFGGTNLSGSMTMNSSGLTLSMSAANPGGGIAASLSGNSTSGGAGYSNITSGTMILAGGNNITLSQDGSRITISGANAGGAQTGISSIAGGGTTYTSGSIQFVNSYNVSILSTTGQGFVMSASYPVQTVQPVAYSAANGSANFSTLSFANSNNVSFSTGAGGVYATASYAAQTQQPMYFSASGGSSSSNTLGFSNANGFTFSNSAGSVIGSYTVPTVTQYFSNTGTTFGGTNISGSMTLNTNGLVLSLSGGAGGAGDGYNIVSMLTSTSGGGTAGATYSALSGSIGFMAGSNITLSQTSNTIVINGGAGAGGVAIANSQTTYTSGTVNFLEGGGAITIGSSAGQKYTVSVPQTSQLSAQANITISTAGNTIYFSAGTLAAGGGAALQGSGTYTQNTGTIQFQNSNGMTFGLSNNGVMTGSFSAPPVQTYQPMAYSASGGSSTANTMTFGNANGFTFSNNGGTIQGSYTVPSGMEIFAGTGVATVGTLSFLNFAGGVWGYTTAAGQAGTLAYTPPAAALYIGGSNGQYNSVTIQFINTGDASWFTTLSGGVSGEIALSLPLYIRGIAGSNALTATSGTVQFANGNNITFGLNANTITASASFAQTNQTGNFYVTANSTQLSSVAGIDLRSISFAGAGAASVGLSNSVILVSVPNFATSEVGLNTAGTNMTWTVNSSGISINAAGYAGTTTAITGNASITLNSLGMQFNGTGLAGTGTSIASTAGNYSMVLNSAGHTLSVPYLTRAMFPDNQWTTASVFGNATASFQYVSNNVPVTATRMDALFYSSISTNSSTVSFSYSAYGAIYTVNASTLASVSSGSTQGSWSWVSNTGGSTAMQQNAIRPISVPININMAPGEYLVGFNYVTAGAGGTTHTIAPLMGGTGVLGWPGYGEINAATNASRQLMSGMGIYSAATTGLSGSYSISGIVGTGTALQQANIGIVLRNA